MFLVTYCYYHMVDTELLTLINGSKYDIFTISYLYN